MGIVDGEVRLDLDYFDDSRANVDMNVAYTAGGTFVEIQGSAENGQRFARGQMNALLDVAVCGCEGLFGIQRRASRLDGEPSAMSYHVRIGVTINDLRLREAGWIDATQKGIARVFGDEKLASRKKCKNSTPAAATFWYPLYTVNRQSPLASLNVAGLLSQCLGDEGCSPYQSDRWDLLRSHLHRSGSLAIRGGSEKQRGF